MRHVAKYRTIVGALILLVCSSVDAGQEERLAGAQPTERPDFGPEVMQSLYLKGDSLGMQNAAGSAQRAECLVSFWYGADGTVRIAQLVRTSGFSKVDQACLQAVIGRQVKPMGTFGGWTRLAINWVFNRKLDPEAHPRIVPDPAIPTFGSAMQPLPSYPQAALSERAHGVCKLRVTVSASGRIDALEITQSTKSVELDKACSDTIYGLPVVPATRDGQPVGGTTDVAIVWRLPKSEPAP
jgi:TonB family protein